MDGDKQRNNITSPKADALLAISQEAKLRCIQDTPELKPMTPTLNKTF